MPAASVPTLIVITGPTGSGKPRSLSRLRVPSGATSFSADSRQIYKGIPIGTAAPTAAERALVRHHFVEELELDSYYSAALFEEQAIKRLNALWQKGPDVAVMCGGSMMYVDAVVNGIDPCRPSATKSAPVYSRFMTRRASMRLFAPALPRSRKL